MRCVTDPYLLVPTYLSHSPQLLTRCSQLVAMLAGDDVAEVIARTRFFAARYAHRDATQKAFSRKGWARLTWRQRCRSLERVTGVAAPTFHAALGPRGARTTPSWWGGHF